MKNMSRKSIDADEDSWHNPKNTVNLSKQMEQWNKKRQSLYSLNGWCGDNVNQTSKWDVEDLENCLMKDFQERSLETYKGTDIWNQTLKSCPIVPESSPQITEWKNYGAMPKMFDLESLNCLKVNATSLDYPQNSPITQSNQIINTDAFNECDLMKSNEHDGNLGLHLKMESLDLNTDFPDDICSWNMK